jgi:hypothetical protein
MKSSHTPGPWSCSYTSNHAHDYRLFKADGMPLPLNVVANDHSEQRATAQLIASAPDLLELCELSLRALHEDDFPDLRDKLRTAINKATGD